MLFRKIAPITIMMLSCLPLPGLLGQLDKRDATSRDSEQRLQSVANDMDVEKKLVNTYQEFIDEIRATKERTQQIKILNHASTKFNNLLKPILLTDEVSEVFSLLTRVQLINIDPSFRLIIDRHPKPEIRAEGLLNFARHCSNNYRGELAEKTLQLLKTKYGKLNYKGQQTFADAVEDEIFFVNNLANGRPAPNFVAKDADGALLNLEDYRGKVVMLRFWGDWCPPCRAMYDFERELVQRYKSEAFALIGVNSDSLTDMKAAQRRSNLVWRSVWDGGDTAGPVASLYQVESWPTIVVIDADGIIRFRSHGLRKPQLESVIQRCLAKSTRKN